MARQLGLLSVCRARVEANTEKSVKVDCNGLKPVRRVTAWQFGLSSGGQAVGRKSTQAERRAENGGVDGLLTKPGQRTFILRSKINKDKKNLRVRQSEGREWENLMRRRAGDDGKGMMRPK